jgi:hypothetical protein
MILQHHTVNKCTLDRHSSSAKEYYTKSGLSSVAETTMAGALGIVKGTGCACFTVMGSTEGTSCFVGSVGSGLSVAPVAFPLDKTPFQPFILSVFEMKVYFCPVVGSMTLSLGAHGW